MSLSGLNIGIIGGSIAGCAAAHAVRRAGGRVTVFERSAKGLKDRGSGIAIPGPLLQTLQQQVYLPDTFETCALNRRVWQYPDGSALGRTLWSQPTPAFANNWGNLWRALRENVPDDIYRTGQRLQSIEDASERVVAKFEGGEERHFDLLIGADGYQSSVRGKLHPKQVPDYAGYVLWRGNFAERDLVDPELIGWLDDIGAWITVPFRGGHGVLYMIPDFDGQAAPGQRRVNWAVYASCPESQPLNGIESIAPGCVAPDAYAEFQALVSDAFPPAIRKVILQTGHANVSIQPIYDSVVDTYVGERTLLIGDAATMTRPHTASGATKALEDALALESLLTSCADISDLLARYDAARCAQAKTLSEIGRRIGRAQVTDTPDWPNMAPNDFEDWIKATLSGDTLYLYGEKA